METATEKAGKRLTVWERITSIEPAGRKPCACIAVSGDSRLYITDDGIITHNTAGDPRNPLPASYVDRNGKIKVLATVPDVDRKAAALMALPVSQEEPDFATIYRKASPEERRRVTDRFLKSQATDAVTRNSNLAEITTDQDESIANTWRNIMPAFMGNKRKLASHVAQNIRALFTKEQRESYKTLVDYFGGGGSWGLHIALTHFPNIKRLIVHEFDPERIEKIKYFHARGNRFLEDFNGTRANAIIDAAVTESILDELPSPAAILGRLKMPSDATDVERAVIKAFKDQATNDRASGLDESKIRTAEASMREMLKGLVEDAGDTFKGAEEARERGIAFEYVSGDSYRSDIEQGDDVVAVADPPYYKTSGYGDSKKLVPFSIYHQTGSLLQKLRTAKNAIIYTDSAWWVDGNEDEHQHVDFLAPRGLQTELEVLDNSLASVVNYGIIPIKGKTTRHELLGIRNPDETRSIQSPRRLPLRPRISERGVDQGAIRADNKAAVRKVGRKPQAAVSLGELDNRQSREVAEAPTNVLPEGERPIILGDDQITGLSDERLAQGIAKIQEALNLYSQSATPFEQIDALAKKAFAETKAGGPRTVGDPERAHSTDTEHWFALDEYRKSVFQREKESDWLKMSDNMLASDYRGTVNGITAKLAAKETLLPWETKAAEKIIAAEMAKDLYGSPEADKRRRTLYTFVFGLRESRAATARTLAAFRDPHRTPEERMRAFAGELIFTPSAAAERKAAGLTTESEKDRRIATLEERLATLRDMATTSQQQHEEIARLNRDLSEARGEATKEDVFRADADERYERIEKRLRELGVRIEDLMSEQVEVRLMGAKIVGDIAAGFNATEKNVIALSLGKRGGNISDIAERMEVSTDEVKRILQEYQDAMKADLMKKFKLKAMGLDNLLVGGMDKAIKSAPSPDERSDMAAEELALRAMREMGIIPVEEHDATIVRRTRTNQKRSIPKKTDIIGMPAWTHPVGPGASVETMLERHGLVWQDAPTGEGKTTARGKLDLGERAWQDAPTGEGRANPDGSLDLTAGPAQPHQFKVGRFDFDNAAQRLQAMRLMQSAAHGSTAFDYASEIIIANLLSAPTTAVTNMTGYLYGIYRFTFRRALEAGLNFDKNAGAATFGEFRPMFSALANNMGTAFSNAILAWQTETPVTEALRKHMQQDLGMAFDEPIGKIPGKLGRVVRIPMRLLLATDEFAKTLLARTHAAAIAHRMGRAQGYEGKRLAAYVNGQMGDTDSNIWDIALKEARHVTFQDKLRTFAEMDAQEIGSLNKVTHSLEAGLAQLTKYKNDAGPDAGFVHNSAALILRATFPFLKTPYNLLYIGLKESPIGGIWDGIRQKGGFAGKERVKGPLVLEKEQTERRIARLKREAGAAKNPADREKTIRELQESRKTLADIEARRMADPKRGYLFGKADAGKNVNARVAILTSALLTAMLWAFGEGDDDDDEKSLLITGTTPQKDPKAQGQRELRNRTIPEQSIRIRIGGKEYTFSYRRLDPFSTVLATVVDTLASIKGMAKGRTAWEAYARTGSSLTTQVLEKASLRGFSEVANLFLGGKTPTTSDIVNSVAAWTVPNVIRNPMRNSDDMVRDTDYFGDDAAARAKYAFLPSAENAPPPRRDLYGKPIDQRGNAASRIFVPGAPHEQGAFSREDITLRNWNLQNPAAPFAPETPDVKEIVKRYKATPAQIDRWMKVRGEYISTQIQAKGLSGLKRPTAAQIDEFEKIVGKSTEYARKQVFGK